MPRSGRCRCRDRAEFGPISFGNLGTHMRLTDINTKTIHGSTYICYSCSRKPVNSFSFLKPYDHRLGGITENKVCLHSYLDLKNRAQHRAQWLRGRASDSRL